MANLTWFVFLRVSNHIELLGPYEDIATAVVKTRAYKENIEVTGYLLVNSKQLANMLDLITEKLLS